MVRHHTPPLRGRVSRSITIGNSHHLREARTSSDLASRLMRTVTSADGAGRDFFSDDREPGGGRQTG